MVKNLLKIAIRNILKEKGYSAINLLGLSIGITCSLFLTLYVLDELSYDQYHENADDIYRVVSNIQEPDNAFTWAVAQIPLREELVQNHSEVVNAVRFFGTGRTLYKYEDKSFNEEDFLLADSTVFDMFTYQFMYGDKETALDLPNSIVLSESTAIKYFGTTDCLGKSLTDAQNEQFNITGIISDVPENSHFRFDALISRNSAPQRQGSWGNFGVSTYLQFSPGFDPSKFQSNLDSIVSKNVNPIFESIGISIAYELQRMTDIHLYSKIQDEAEEGGDISYIYIFSIVAVFMLVIASINYMNLATARSFKRSKEVGIRKVLGSLKKQLVNQFLTESIVLAVLSLVLGLVLIYALLPYFNDLANKTIAFSMLFQGIVPLILIGIILVIGIVGGLYPAFYLSSFNPAAVLKGRLSSSGGNGLIRKLLVIFQFSISIFMLISTLIVYDQLNFLQNKDLGFDKEQVLRLELAGDDLRDRFDVFKNRLLQLPDVENVSTASSTPGGGMPKTIMDVESNNGEMLEKGVNFYRSDYDYLTTLGIEIIEGRGFSRDIISDTTSSVIVNEAMVDRMAWDAPIGKKFRFPSRDTTLTQEVIGVVKNYHQNSLYDEIEPLIIIFFERNYYAYIKLDSDNIPQMVDLVAGVWQEVYPSNPFEFQFLDQDFDSQYAADQRRGTIFTVFSSLTIIIACLGLLGLTSFTTEQRTKEIGIRKVIGASLNSIVYLISKEFLMLVVLATLLACPFAYYFMDNWLQAFAYRIELKEEWLTFVISAALAIIITLLTVGFHTIKAAMSNPVNAIRNE